jgi:dynein heavy chain 1
VRLRELEESLLNTLSEVRGQILDNDAVISSLETMKRESETVVNEMAKTEETMHEVEVTSNHYMPLAVASSRVYFAMESLSHVHYLYHFSLQFFMSVID